MLDNKGQISLEYLLIVTVSLILLIVFTLPLTEMTITNTLDVSDTLNMKADLSKLTHTISEVYGQGQGAKQSVTLQSPQATKLNIGGNYITCNVKLKDGSNKQIRLNYKSNLAKTTIPISKGTNTITVEWPVGSENMIIYAQ